MFTNGHMIRCIPSCAWMSHRGNSLVRRVALLPQNQVTARASITSTSGTACAMSSWLSSLSVESGWSASRSEKRKKTGRASCRTLNRCIKTRCASRWSWTISTPTALGRSMKPSIRPWQKLSGGDSNSSLLRSMDPGSTWRKSN